MLKLLFVCKSSKNTLMIITVFCRRRKECGAGGVAECDGIPGCCPEHFDIVFGAGVYLATDN